MQDFNSYKKNFRQLFSSFLDSISLQEYQKERLRRIRQFEECSKRVRDAKKNGLWRYTSWGGSFQQVSSNQKILNRNTTISFTIIITVV